MTEIATIDWFVGWGTSVFSENTAIFILAGNKDMHKISDEFKFRPYRTTDYGVSYL